MLINVSEHKYVGPCPFCRTNDDLYFGEDKSEGQEDEEDNGHTYAYHVRCGRCGCKGRNRYAIGWCESHEAALQAWNDRGVEIHRNYAIEPFGPTGQFALYSNRISPEHGFRLCTMYDFGNDNRKATQLRALLVDLLNEASKLP